MRILIVDDEPLELDQLEWMIHSFDPSWQVFRAVDGNEALGCLKKTSFDLILLDINMPGLNGLEVAERLRVDYPNLPIIMVTAKTEEIDRLSGLEIGADDYICKPYSPREVVARVKAILKRCYQPARDLPLPINSGLQLDESQFMVRYNQMTLDLTSAEFRLLKALSDHPGQVLSRESLLDNLYDDYRVVTDRTVDSHIKNLRRKLETFAPEKTFIRSVYGMGYRWEG